MTVFTSGTFYYATSFEIQQQRQQRKRRHNKEPVLALIKTKNRTNAYTLFIIY